jgi:hypothetical protein
LGAVEFRGTGWRLWIAGTLGQGCLVLVVEWIAKGKGVAEAFFDQITTTARQRSAANPRGRIIRQETARRACRKPFL